ncbi:hypothetical protein O9992_01895 [Vibrio lentus]|nr:hypothetical protein [Vibrio lentus]
MHGKVSMMEHNHATYQGLPSPLAIARYHSLVATHVSDSLTVTAEVDDLSDVCGSRTRQGLWIPIPPESIMTTYGATLLANAIEWALEKPIHLEEKLSP